MCNDCLCPFRTHLRAELVITLRPQTSLCVVEDTSSKDTECQDARHEGILIK